MMDYSVKILAGGQYVRTGHPVYEVSLRVNLLGVTLFFICEYQNTIPQCSDLANFSFSSIHDNLFIN
jgi:hypothetical protein